MRKAIDFRKTIDGARRAAPDTLWLFGLALVAYGIGLVFLPAGIIAGGLALCFAGYALGGDE